MFNKLNTDELNLILKHLSVKEVSNLCKTCKSLSRIYTDSRFNSVWIRLIRDDFGIEYNSNKYKKAYEEYKRLQSLTKFPIYLLTIQYEYEPDKEIFLFTGKEKAREFLRIYLQDQMQYYDEQVQVQENAKIQIDKLDRYDYILGYSVDLEINYLNDSLK